MTEPQTVTADHLRELLARGGDASLALQGGQVRVLDADEADDALEIVTVADVRDRLGTDPGDEELTSEAHALTSAAQGLGG